MKKFKYEHEYDMIENAVNNINQTAYIHNVWTLNKYSWHRSISGYSRRYLLLGRKVENQHLTREESNVRKFKMFKTLYLNQTILLFKD